MPLILAIDGPSASGKGTIARRLANYFHFAYLDTGLLYRAVGLAVILNEGHPEDPIAATAAAQALNPSSVMALADDPALRSDQTSIAASKVAAVPSVRAALLDFQRAFAAHPPHEARGAVLDGRDIGTVIAPDAMVKIYVTASPEVRATRRMKELQKRGENVTYPEVLADLQDRDTRDAQRATAPAKPADDAVLLDTSHLTADEAFAQALTLVQAKGLVA